GGKNIIQMQYENAGALLQYKRMKLDDAEKQAWAAKLFPARFEPDPEEVERRKRIQELQSAQRMLTVRLRESQRLTRNFNSDPTAVALSKRLNGVLDELAALQHQAGPRLEFSDPSEVIVASMRKEVESIEEQSKGLLKQLKETMPEHQRFLGLQD